MPPATPTASEIQLAPSTTAGISATAAAKVKQVGDHPGADEGERGTVAAEHEGLAVDEGRGGGTTDGPDGEQREHREGAVAPFEQPSVERDRAQRGEGEPDVVVDEGRGDQPPPVRARLADDDYLAEAEQARAPEQAAEQPERDQPDREVGVRFAADPGDFAPTQPGERWGWGPPALLGQAAVAVELRRALAQPVAAVRALGDVRAHFGPAAPTDDEQVRVTGAHR